jgi:uncharacterized protein
MNIILTGGTGLIGKRVVATLLSEQHSVSVLTRQARQSDNNGVRFLQWDAASMGTWAEEFHTVDAVIHLAGEGIFDERWTAEVKKRLVESRTKTARLLVEAIASAEAKPRVMVSMSGVGYYGDRGNALLDESAPPGRPDDFLAQLSVEWEAAANEAKHYGVRVATSRTGIVLAKEGGALGRMAPVFRLFVGMPLGSGNQWFPWIHIDDVVRGILHPLTSTLEGAYNLASPNPVTMNDFSDELGAALRRPSWSFLSVPEFALKLGLGEAAYSLVGGQRIVPARLLESGFRFEFSNLMLALNNIYA